MSRNMAWCPHHRAENILIIMLLLEMLLLLMLLDVMDSLLLLHYWLYGAGTWRGDMRLRNGRPKMGRKGLNRSRSLF